MTCCEVDGKTKLTKNIIYHIVEYDKATILAGCCFFDVYGLNCYSFTRNKVETS